MSESSVRTIVGEVVSDKRDKTIAILVSRKVKHQKYGKYIVRSSKVHAHDAKNESKIGDMVRVAEIRPLSKTKTWELVEILNSGE